MLYSRYLLFQFSSVTLSCPTLCNLMDCSTPGFSVHHQLPEPTQTHVHSIRDAIQPSHLLPSPSPPAFNLFCLPSLYIVVSLYLLIPNSGFPHPHHFHHSLYSMSLGLYLLCYKFICILFFFFWDFTYKQYHAIYVFLCLTSPLLCPCQLRCFVCSFSLSVMTCLMIWLIQATFFPSSFQSNAFLISLWFFSFSFHCTYPISCQCLKATLQGRSHPFQLPSYLPIQLPMRLGRVNYPSWTAKMPVTFRPYYFRIHILSQYHQHSWVLLLFYFFP